MCSNHFSLTILNMTLKDLSRSTKTFLSKCLYQSQISPQEVVKIAIIKEINAKRASGFALITGRCYKKRPTTKVQVIEVLRVIMFTCTAEFRVGFYPCLWKLEQILKLPKPGKPVQEITSYKPVRLLPVPSKVFEKLLLRRLQHLINSQNIILDYQFGCCKKHSTIELANCIVNKIYNDLEERRHCSTEYLCSKCLSYVFAYGLYEMKKHLPHPYYSILKSYLGER